MIPSKSKRRVIFHLAFIYGTAEKLHSDAEVRMSLLRVHLLPIEVLESLRVFS